MRFVMSMSLLCVVLVGCSSDTAPPPTSIDGPWSQDFSVPGSFLTMTEQQLIFGVITGKHFDGAFSGVYTLVGTETSDSGSGAQSVIFHHPVVDPV